MKLIIDTLGWLGALAVLIAYALISSRRVEATSMSYHGLNLVGAVGLGANTIFYTAYPSTIVNAVWGFIAVAAIYRFWPGKQSPESG